MDERIFHKVYNFIPEGGRGIIEETSPGGTEWRKEDHYEMDETGTGLVMLCKY